jgi:hypothetical protein
MKAGNIRGRISAWRRRLARGFMSVGQRTVMRGTMFEFNRHRDALQKSWIINIMVTTNREEKSGGNRPGGECPWRTT